MFDHVKHGIFALTGNSWSLVDFNRLTARSSQRAKVDTQFAGSLKSRSKKVVEHQLHTAVKGSC